MTRSKDHTSPSYSDALRSLALPLLEVTRFEVPFDTLASAKNFRLGYYAWRSAFLLHMKEQEQEQKFLEENVTGPLNARLLILDNPPRLVVERGLDSNELQARIDAAVELSRQQMLEGEAAPPGDAQTNHQP